MSIKANSCLDFFIGIKNVVIVEIKICATPISLKSFIMHCIIIVHFLYRFQVLWGEEMKLFFVVYIVLEHVCPNYFKTFQKLFEYSYNVRIFHSWHDYY